MTVYIDYDTHNGHTKSCTLKYIYILYWTDVNIQTCALIRKEFNNYNIKQVKSSYNV